MDSIPVLICYLDLCVVTGLDSCHADMSLDHKRSPGMRMTWLSTTEHLTSLVLISVLKQCIWKTCNARLCVIVSQH